VTPLQWWGGGFAEVLPETHPLLPGLAIFDLIAFSTSSRANKRKGHIFSSVSTLGSAFESSNKPFSIGIGMEEKLSQFSAIKIFKLLYSNKK
jgi:hypothetical protein